MPWSDLILSGESVVTCVANVMRRKRARSRLMRRRRSISVRALPLTWSHALIALLLLSGSIGASGLPTPDAWVPIRWTGGPLELAWRNHSKTLPTDAAVAQALARWYEPSTLTLLDGSPVNCLLVTWSAPADALAEAEQHQLVKDYTAAAHKRGLAVVGLVYAAGDARTIAGDASRAALDALVLEGEFGPEFPAALRKAAASMLVIEVSKDAASWRWKPAPVVAVTGVAPSGRNLSEMGIRGAPSSEPWIESNIWLIRSFGAISPPPAVWISSQLESTSPIDYARAVSDAAIAGGRWIVSLDDALRAKMRAGDASALQTWRYLTSYLKFADSHTAWRVLAPYGNVAIVLDSTNAKRDLADEYLNLVARRQVPYRVLARAELNAAALANFRAAVAIELDPLSPAERQVLQDFAEGGGLLVASAAWGGAPKTEQFSELPQGKGRIVVYRDPDPAAVARDLKELLSDDELGMVPFNVPSVLTFVSASGDRQTLLVQLLNYFDHPVEAITLRMAGKFRAARLETPESAPLDLALRVAEGNTEITIPKLFLWGAVSLQ